MTLNLCGKRVSSRTAQKLITAMCLMLVVLTVTVLVLTLGDSDRPEDGTPVTLPPPPAPAAQMPPAPTSPAPTRPPPSPPPPLRNPLPTPPPVPPPTPTLHPPSFNSIRADGVPVLGMIRRAGNEAWFLLAADEGERYTLTVEASSLPSAVLAVWSIDVSTVLVQNDPTEQPPIIRWVCPEEGVYPLMLRDFGAATGTFMLTVARASQPVPPPPRGAAAVQPRTCQDILATASQSGTVLHGDADDYVVYLTEPTEQGGTPTSVSCDMTNGGWTKVINVPGSTPESTYAVAEAVSQGIANSPRVFWKLSDEAINSMNGAGYFQYRCGSCVDRFLRTTEQTWSSIRNNGLSWEEDRDKDEVFECDAVARSGYVFSDYPATPLIDNAVCSTTDHTNYGEGSSQSGCYAAACGGWGQPASVWVRHSADVCVPLDGEPRLNGNSFAVDGVASATICAVFGMVYPEGGLREESRRDIDFIWYPEERTDVCVSIGEQNRYGGTVLDVQGPANDRMCLVHWDPADSEPFISHLQCTCPGKSTEVLYDWCVVHWCVDGSVLQSTLQWL